MDGEYDLENTREAKIRAFDRLLNIVDDLRKKCPWDRKQTMKTLRPLTIEETYELGDAILDDDLKKTKEELGDLFLHLVFYSKIGEEKQTFDVADVLNSICEKLIWRHPHIYADMKVFGEEEVKANWEKLKLKEDRKSVIQGIPKSLPAMIKAARIQEKARGVGFDWVNTQQVWAKVEEELKELHREIDEGNHKKSEEEFGDLLFSMTNLSRFLNIDAESALERTNKKFVKRFQYLEAKVTEQNQSFSDMSLAEMDAIWEKAKKLD